jgi:hypothetical protein
MADNVGILDKVYFLLKISKSKRYTQDDLNRILDYTKEHTDSLIIGRVFGYSVSDYAIAVLKWINTDETVSEFNKMIHSLPESRRKTISELIKSEVYKQI